MGSHICHYRVAIPKLGEGKDSHNSLNSLRKYSRRGLAFVWKHCCFAVNIILGIALVLSFDSNQTVVQDCEICNANVSARFSIEIQNLAALIVHLNSVT